MKISVKASMCNVTAIRHFKLDHLMKIQFFKVKVTNFYSNKHSTL